MTPRHPEWEKQLYFQTLGVKEKDKPSGHIVTDTNTQVLRYWDGATPMDPVFLEPPNTRFTPSREYALKHSPEGNGQRAMNAYILMMDIIQSPHYYVWEFPDSQPSFEDATGRSVHQKYALPQPSDKGLEPEVWPIHFAN